MKKTALVLLTVLLLALAVFSCAAEEITSVSQLNARNVIVGVSQGSAAELAVRSQLPQAGMAYFTDNQTAYMAVAQGKIDAYAFDLNQMRIAIEQGVSGVHLLDATMDETVRVAVGISPASKIPDIKNKLNQFIAEMRQAGTLNDMYTRWVLKRDEALPQIALPDQPAAHLTVGTTGISPPYTYYAGDRLTGYDIELAYRFAAWLGADVQFKVYDYAGVVPAAMTGDVDCIMANLNITQERQEVLDFSDVLYEEKIGIMVRGEGRKPAWQAYNGKRLGVITGGLMEQIAHTYFPDSEYMYLESYPDCATALLAGRIDAYPADEPGLKAVHAEEPRIDYIRERITNQEYSFAFRKNDAKSAALCKELNAFLALANQDGTIAELDEIWFGTDEARKVVDMSGLTGENGTIRVVTTSSDMPFSYIKDGQNVGYDIDLVVRFCRYAGYKLELGDVSFAARIPAVQSGRYDFSTDMNVTEERKEQVLFSDPTSYGGVVLAVLSANQPAEQAAEDPFSQFAGKRIGVQVGTTSGEQVTAKIPSAKLLYYNNQTDLLAALRARKIDAWGTDETIPKFLMMENNDLRILDGYLDTFELAAIFAKNEKGQALCDQYSAFVDSLWADGTMAAMDDIWFGRDEAKRQVLDYEALPATNGTLRMAADTSLVPFVYVKDNRIVGYDVDIAARFCQQNGYRLVVEPMDFSGVLPSVQSGKADFAACGITITEERKESVLFSSANYKTGAVLTVLNSEAEMAAQTKKITLDDLNGKRIGVVTGTISGRLAEKRLPDVQVHYFNAQTDCLASLQAGKTDAWGTDEPILRFMQIEYPQLEILDERLAESNLAAVFPKTEAGQALRDQFSEFLDKKWADGTMAEIDAIWFGADEAKRTVLDYESLPATNGTLLMAADLIQPPFTYMKDGRAVGYDIDVAARFCQEYGYGLEIQSMSFDGVLAAVQTGKCDFACSSITVTEERAESMLFSTPDYYGSIAVAVWNEKKADGAAMAELNEPNKADIPAGVYTALSQLADKKIGVQTGTSFDKSVAALFPNAQIEYYNSKPDMINALQTYKIEAYAVDEPVAKAQMQQNDKLTYIPEYIESFDFAYVFAKNEAGQALCDQFSEYLDAIRADGTMAEIEAKWFSEDESVKTLADYKAFPATNGTLNMATEAMYEPFSYVIGNEVVGYDIDIVVRFCQAYGYGLTITDMSFDAVLPAVQSGKCDFGGAGITITEERKESVLFSAPNFSGGTVMAVLKAQAQTAAAETEAPSGFSAFWEGIKSSFNKTFLRENRWKLFLEGVGNTMLITALAILFGTALGFALFMLCRNGAPVANGCTRFSMWLVQGTPMVVLLMILYYVIFGSVAISSIAVAVIGFTLTFGAAVFGMLKMGVGMIDQGQYEAAFALGHSNTRTFFKIILPQAIPHVLPAYQGEIVGLIKATAIVGYIAVQDLTKMGDIVRSRTYEAFFPLIAITVIYFVLEGLFSFLVSRIRISIDPKKRKRSKILKGVKEHD